MAAFDYIALDNDGKRHKGVIEADSERQTRQILRERALTPFIIHSSSKPALRQSWKMRSVSLREISLLTRQLATLVQASLPVEQALQALSKQSENPKIKSMLAAVRAQVIEGQTLAKSLAAFPGSFSDLYCASVHAGERTGHLGTVLEYLADFTESSYQARQKIFLALLYPIILSVVSLAIIIFLLAYIMPDMIRVFTDADHVLPLLTRGVIALSTGIQNYGFIIILLFIPVIIFAKRAFKRSDMRLLFDRKILKLPIIGALALQYNNTRFTSTLGMLQESGVPLVQALEIAESVIGNRHIRAAAHEVTKNVREGISLSRALEKDSIFSPVLITMAASGEVSGQLGRMLTRASTLMQRDLENRISVLLGLFEPMVLLIMGGIVLMLVLSIIMPILNLNQLVK